MQNLRDKLSERRIIDIVGLTACVLLTAVVYFVGISPMLEQREARAAQRDQLENKQKRAQSIETSVQKLRAQLQRAQQAVADKSLRLKPLSTLNQRLSQITALATRSDLQIERIRPGETRPGDHYYTVPIRVTGRGEFRASTVFLHRLHAARPDIAVAALSLTGRPDRPAEKQTAPQFDFTLLWHAAPPASTDQPQDGP